MECEGRRWETKGKIEVFFFSLEICWHWLLQLEQQKKQAEELKLKEAAHKESNSSKSKTEENATKPPLKSGSHNNSHKKSHQNANNNAYQGESCRRFFFFIAGSDLFIDYIDFKSIRF